MPPILFSYTARNDAGAFVAGSMQAESREAALANLRNRSLFVTSLELTESAKATLTAALAGLPIDDTARVAFFRSFATLIASAVPMRRALDITIEQCRNARLREALSSVASDIDNGSALSAAMARRPREFPRLFVAMIRAGEVGGVLDDVLERLAQLLERDRATRKRVVSALSYPAMVTLAAVLLVLFLVANVVPAFSSMFAQMHVALPLSTRMLIAAGTGLRNPFVWFVLLITPLAVAVALRVARGSHLVRSTIDGIVLLVPVFGAIVRKSTIARMTRTLGTLLRSGVAVMTALDACEDVVDNAPYAQAMRNLADSLRQGEPMTASLARSGLFDPMFLALVRVGEETGALDAMLLRVAQYYDLDVETAIATLGSILEPALIIILGAIVGTIVASILIPLYSVIGSIK